MRLRPKEIEVPESAPFKFDLLNREPIAGALTELLKKSQDGLVMGMNAPWGHGKSSFLKMWRQSLINTGFRTIYFNAWETDFSEDALISLLGELDNGLRETLQSMGAEASVAAVKSIEKAKRLGAGLIKKSIPSIIKIATAGILDVDSFSEEVIAEFSGKIAEEKIKEYEESRRSIVEFRSSIQEAAELLSTEDKEGASLPLVLIIDELDRCRPNYAIRILECVKHFFSVSGVVFVVAIDREQLSHSVKKEYGIGMDSTGYLRRFFDVELSIPEPDHRRFAAAQFERFELNEAFAERSKGQVTRYDKENLIHALPDLFSCFRFSLRDQERAFTLLALAISTTPSNYFLHPELLATLIVLKIKDPEVYEGFCLGTTSVESVVERIEAGPGGRALMSSRVGLFVETLLYASRCKEHESGILLGGLTDRANKSQDSDVKIRTSNILQLLGDFHMRKAYGSLSYVRGKIDLVDSMRQ